MGPDDKDNNESTAHRSAQEPSPANVVVIPFRTGLTSNSQGKWPIVLPSSSPPPPLSSATPSRSRASRVQQNSTLLTGKDDALGLPQPSELVIQQTGPQFDVYAKPYVPAVLRSINEETAGSVLVTETRHKIGFKSYISTFAGRSFLTHQPDIGHEWPGYGSPPATELTEQSYVRHFGLLLKRECAAKEQENDQHAMYRVPLQEIPTPNYTRLWALSVPGLREDSPFIEMGDTLQIRQLWANPTGEPMPVPLFDQSGNYVYQSWTGRQYNASVHSVSRVHETVYLVADGLEYLTPFYSPGFLPMIVNVVIPLKLGVLQGQRMALRAIGQRLEEAYQRQREAPVDLNGCSPSSFDLQSVPGTSAPVYTSMNNWTRRMLFPTESDAQLQTQLRNIPHCAFFDHAINYEQAHAVKAICRVDYGTLPYLISGPPGTGKTKTLVETAMQLLNTTDVSHILICAPSDAAADTLALRLKQNLNPKQLFRLNRPNRADNEVPRELLQYCYRQDDMFYLPPFKTVLSYSVVVTSCRDAAILAEARLTNADLWTMERDLVASLHPENDPPMPSLHWGALFLDEAAQATEIDALPAISVVCPPSAFAQDRTQPRLVMAGDENQLGPRTASNDQAYSTSLFARLFARPLYASHPLSRSNIKPSSGPPVLKRSMLPILYPPFTNLIRNYRSHPAILSVPSSLFYHDTLIPEAPPANTPLQTSSLWRGRKWPVLYIPHMGADEIERDNGGWYNISEARLACSLAQALVFDSAVKQEDICIMSPFAAQVKCVRSLIRSPRYAGGAGLWDVNIGPVEAFQGLEKRVVILCTTRTRSRFVDDDVRRGLGLVRQRRKMNVALTRAREGLLVIGSPEVLGADEHWRAWMAFCERNGLVGDGGGVWKDRETFRGGPVGVLERALVAKENGLREKQWPALGAAADYHVSGGEYEVWAESLRQALDDEADGDDGEDGDETDDDEKRKSTPESNEI